MNKKKSSPKALVLLSGGIDSPVAGYLLKDKLDLEAIHFSLEPFVGPESVEKSKKAAKLLGIKKLHIIRHGELQARISKECTHKYFFLLTKRLMFKTAEKLAEKLGCEFLITGENMSQVSSQTLPNLVAINSCTKMHILRPLLTYDKNEIVNIAEKIGSFEFSKGPETCDVLGPKNPATNVPTHIIEMEEAKIKEDLVEEGLKNLSVENMMPKEV